MANAQKDLGPAGPKKPTPLKAPPKKGLRARLMALPSGVKVAAAAGAGALLVFGSPAVIPVGIGSAALGGWYALKGKIGKYSRAMTPERIKIYEAAISTLKDTKKLRALADEFERAGCLKEAEHLRKRAALRDRTPVQKKADQARYRKAMADTDPKRVEAEAVYFEGLGADGTAKNLRTRVAALRAVQKRGLFS